MGFVGLDVVGDEGEGYLRHSSPVCGTLDADALTEKGNTWEEMHKNASQPSHMLDSVIGTCLVVHA